MVNLIDAILTAAFWLPAKLIGYEKCSKCTVRVRWYQFLMMATRPLSRVSGVRARRAGWALRADPPQRSPLRPVSTEEIENNA